MIALIILFMATSYAHKNYQLVAHLTSYILHHSCDVIVLK